MQELRDFLKNLAAMVKVKTVVTLTVIGVFAHLAVDGGDPCRYGDDDCDHGGGVLLWYPERAQSTITDTNK